ncbi:hypothetical protein [Treponema phagedenis]|uniref:hypothetical protein n=1 Tax=Treponema phagedenis TaxID=162 RepID=UPI0011E80782|nr:hypothetical protein [Treponema phagedenis]NVP23149.1 hypothetical protein [Treponema phagedenis]QEK03548.1 hypothetical protein FUT83_06860 [Treponema phagedenis]QLC58014.1 hypothetical protein HW453_03735 [Treponema phagedenis]
MVNYNISLDDAAFAYLVYDKKHEGFSNHILLKEHNLYLNYSKKTEVLYYTNNENSIYIIGLCVDSHAELERSQIPAFLLTNNPGTIDEIIKMSARFAGNYVVLVSLEKELFAYTDATAFLQINYSKDAICFSSFAHLVAKILNKPFDECNLKIRESADYVAAMPNDITVYKNIKTVLPNHYFHINKFDVCRFYPYEELEYYDSYTDILNRHIVLIDNIVKEYAKYNNLVCPLTSGWDSRVVFSFLTRNIPDIQSYTFFHKNFTAETPDIVIPKKICKLKNKKYIQIPDLQPSDEFVSKITEIIGQHYYKSDIAMAYTYKDTFGASASITGDIIDQLGKSALVNLLPTFLATSNYFVAKKRNISPDAKKEVAIYLKRIKKEKHNWPYVYDLFGLEDQCGRWAGYARTIYSAAGITLLNIFNCKEIIDDWIRIRRSKRKKHCIHIYFLHALARDLLQIPFNPDEKFKFVSNSKVLFFLATHIRHLIKKIRKPHLKKNKKG